MEELKWKVVYVASRQEKKVAMRLEKEGIKYFLPLYRKLSQWSDRKKWVEFPLFNGYLFVQPDAWQRDKLLELPGIIAYLRYNKEDAVVRDEEITTIQKITANKKITEFSPGDTIKVGVKIVEGKRERIQYFEGVCIAKKNRDLNSSFTVRKISFGEGVERTFALYSPNVDSIKVIRSGKVRRAKLYYLRDRKGKSARIAEKIKKKIGVDVSVKAEEPNKVAEPIKVEATAKKESSVEKKETSPEVKNEKSAKEKK